MPLRWAGTPLCEMNSVTCTFGITPLEFLHQLALVRCELLDEILHRLFFDMRDSTRRDMSHPLQSGVHLPFP